MAARAWVRRSGGAALAVLIGMAGAGVAEALWSQRAPLTGTLTSGNLVLAVDGESTGVVVVPLGQLEPNLTTHRDEYVAFTVSNPGTTAFSYSVSPSVSGAGSSGVQVGVGVATSRSACEEGTSYSEDSFAVLPATSGAPSASEVVCVRIRLPAVSDEAFATGPVSIELDFSAEQWPAAP